MKIGRFWFLGAFGDEISNNVRNMASFHGGIGKPIALLFDAKIGRYFQSCLEILLQEMQLTLEIWANFHGEIGKPIALLFAMKTGRFSNVAWRFGDEISKERWKYGPIFMAKLVSL